MIQVVQIIDFGNAVNYGSEQFFMYSRIVTECFHNKCFKLSTLRSVYIPWGCESDMILSVMTGLYRAAHEVGKFQAPMPKTQEKKLKRHQIQLLSVSPPRDVYFKENQA